MHSDLIRLVAVLMFLGGLCHMLSAIDRPVSAAAGAVVFTGGLLMAVLAGIADRLDTIHNDLVARPPQDPPRAPKRP